MDPYEALEALTTFAPQQGKWTQMGTVKSAQVDNKVTVRFDGDDVDSGGGFVVVSGLAVSVSDRVLLLRAGSSYVVLAKLP